MNIIDKVFTDDKHKWSAVVPYFFIKNYISELDNQNEYVQLYERYIQSFKNGKPYDSNKNILNVFCLYIESLYEKACTENISNKDSNYITTALDEIEKYLGECENNYCQNRAQYSYLKDLQKAMEADLEKWDTTSAIRGMARKIGHTARVTNERCGRKYTIQD
jgi:thermostable 8-oxoguanine DNA glycosylase